MKARNSVLSAVVALGALVTFAGLPAGVALAGTGIKVPVRARGEARPGWSPRSMRLTPPGAERSLWRRGAPTR